MAENIEAQPEEAVEEQQKPSCLTKLKVHKFKILGGVLGILVFAGAVFGAYKIGQKQVKSGLGPTPTPEAVATPTLDPTADWVVYQDIECGYSIKYPPRWFLNRASACLSQFSDIKSDDPSETRVSVYTILSTREEVMERYNAEIGQKLKHGDIVEEKIANLTIGSEPAVRLTRTSLEGKLYSVFVLFAKDNRVFEIVNVVKNKTDQQRYNDTFDLILSTFKFLPSAGSGQGEKVFCEDPRPEVCTMECIVNPPYICGSDGKSYCSECQACADPDIEWYVIQDELCKAE